MLVMAATTSLVLGVDVELKDTFNLDCIFFDGPGLQVVTHKQHSSHNKKDSDTPMPKQAFEFCTVYLEKWVMTYSA